MTEERNIFADIDLETMRLNLADEGVQLLAGQVAEAIVIELKAEQVSLRLEIRTDLDERGMKLPGHHWARSVRSLLATATKAATVYTRWGSE